MPPQVELLDATAADRALVRRLLQLYRYDFSEFDGSDVNRHGEYVNRHFGEYSTDPERVAVVFRAAIPVPFEESVRGGQIVQTFTTQS